LPGPRRGDDERRELRRDELRKLHLLAVLGGLRLALHAFGALHRDLVARLRLVVVALDQQPCGPVLVAARAREDPRTVQLLALEAEVQPALAQRIERIGVLGRPDPLVPQQHLAGPVLLLRDHAFELAVVERMILGLHREALVGRIEAWSLRHGPALQDALELEPKVVVQARRGVALDEIAQLLRVALELSSPRLRRDAEIAHLAIAFEALGHGRRSAKHAPAPGNCYCARASLTAFSL
jgi:hypothetical protein